jgi:GT2 family glycosyltransferase
LTAGLLNLNQAGLTISVLDALARLSSEDWSIQLILLDNGSSDKQVQELTDWFFANKSHFAEVVFVTASHNLGANGGRNVVLKLATGEAILILDNDLVLPHDSTWLDSLWKGMEDNPTCGIISPMLVFAAYPDIVQGTGIGLTDRGRVSYLNRAESVEHVPPTLVEVVASPAACWLIRSEAKEAVGLFSDEFYPMQYWDVDYCVRLGLADWKILCDRSIRIQHIENVTTRNLGDHPYARVAARHAMKFRDKWAEVLPQLATITDENIYWGPIPRLEE